MREDNSSSMRTCEIKMRTFLRLWTLTLLTTGNLFAQVSPTESESHAPKAAEVNSPPVQRAASAPTPTLTNTVSETPIKAEAASGTNIILNQFKIQTVPSRMKAALAGRNDLSQQISNLEPTGQYVERDIRIPEGDSGGAKFVRFLIPVYKEKEIKQAADRGKPYR